MAPELALNALKSLSPGSIVLDPMSGSGTVLRQAVELGHKALGFDVDPLAILMTHVWTTPIEEEVLARECGLVLKDAALVDLRKQRLPWVDRETETFMKYWFGDLQRRDLYRIAWVFHTRRLSNLGERRRAAVNALMVAFSRIIVTKDQGASLARDTSHSRPHKVAEESTYDVFSGFERSVAALGARLRSTFPGSSTVGFGDARRVLLRGRSVDAVLTSPPYLNAIDYMRGHRLALIWLGYSLSQLRTIRSTSIGAERRCFNADQKRDDVGASMLGASDVPDRLRFMVQRYAGDLISMMSEISRVLKEGGKATIVVGNSCLKGVFVENAKGVRLAGSLAGLTLTDLVERDLPASSRYLPIPTSGSLSKRMRTEVVLTFHKP
jgi:hypothetical protein